MTLDKRLINKILSGALIVSVLGFAGCSKSNNKSDSNNGSINNLKAEEDNSINVEDKVGIGGNNSIDSTKEDNKTPLEEETNIKFVKHQLEDDVEPEFGTEWFVSPNEKLEASIEGKGPDLLEDGIGKLYIKDMDDKRSWSFEIMDNDEQLSPAFLEWLNDEELLTILSHGYDSSFSGGNLYKLNPRSGELKVIYDTKDEKRQVIKAKKIDDNKIELEILVYDDDEFIKTHTESKVIILE